MDYNMMSSNCGCWIICLMWVGNLVEMNKMVVNYIVSNVIRLMVIGSVQMQFGIVVCYFIIMSINVSISNIEKFVIQLFCFNVCFYFFLMLGVKDGMR